MKSHSERESPRRNDRPVGRASSSRIPSVLVLLILLVSPSRADALSITGLARLEASDRIDLHQTGELLQGYISLGFPGDAADRLERMIRLGELSRDDARRWFEELAAEAESARPEERIAVGETAVRNGVVSPLILYSYASALRQGGRAGEAQAVFSRIPAGDSFHPFASYAVGQIFAEKGDHSAALDVFDRLSASLAEPPGPPALVKRLRRSRAELLLVMGRTAEAGPEFEALAGEDDDPMVRIGLFAARRDSSGGAGAPPPEAMTGWSARDRILYSLLMGTLAGERGDFDSGRTHLSRAEEEIRASLGAAAPPAGEGPIAEGGGGSLRTQIEHHTALRQLVSRMPAPHDTEAVRGDLVELLGGLLVLDHSVGRAAESIGPAGERAPAGLMTPERMGEVLDSIEKTALDGLEVDRLVKEFERRLDVLQNLAHPIHRFRLLAKLEKGQAEILALRERISRRREEAAARLAGGDRTDTFPMVKDLGRFLSELESMRATANEIMALTREKFRVIRWEDMAKGSAPEAVQERIRAVLALDGDLFPAVARGRAEVEKRISRDAWEREKERLVALRSTVLRSACDLDTRYAMSTRQAGTDDFGMDGRAALDRVVSRIERERMEPGDRIACALGAAALLVDGPGRWSDFPEKSPGEPEGPMMRALLRPLEEGAAVPGTREDALFLAAMVRMRLGDRDAGAAGREFLAAFPSSPRAGDIAVRLGHDALTSRRADDARALYAIAAESPNPDASAVGRAMRGWMMYQEGDAQAAVRELAGPLADPSFQCDEPTPFEETVLGLAVRAWQGTPLDGLKDYRPVQKGLCGGRLLLVRLGEAESGRGETGRAASVYDLFTQRFPDDRAAPEYEKKTVEGLLKTGQEGPAVERALRMSEKYGPGSPWSESRPRAEDRKTREELAQLLASLSEKKFEEGIRSGDQGAMSTSAEIMDRLFELKGDETSPSDAELRLKWAVASLQGGDRETAILLIEELLGEEREDALGEKAAIIYADTMIASYERKEQSPDDAEDAALYLMGNYPSEKAASMGLRAAQGFLEGGDSARAARMALEVERDRNASRPVAAEAGLIRARVSFDENDFRSARIGAAAILDGPAGGTDAGIRARVLDLYMLAALREADALAEARDFRGAADRIEEVLGRFPASPEAPDYLLRAIRLRRSADDAEGLLRAGTLFLSKYPLRQESLDVAATLGAHWEESGEPVKAAEIFAETSRRFPPGEKAAKLLFRAGTLFRGNGREEDARKVFSAYRTAYVNPRWMTAYAALAVGLADWKAGRVKTAVQGLEDGIRLADGETEKEAPEEFLELAGQARLAIGEYWSDQFRGIRLAQPLEKNLALKTRFFKRALSALEKAEAASPFTASINAVLLSGDLFVEFGKAIRDSGRPKGLKGDDLRQYEVELGARSRTYFERALELYEEALARLEAEDGPSDLAIPIRQRMEETQTLLEGDQEKSS